MTRSQQTSVRPEGGVDPAVAPVLAQDGPGDGALAADAGDVSRRLMLQRAGVGAALLAGASVLSAPAALANPGDPMLVREAPEPTEPNHVATKRYVDAASQTLTERIDNLDPEVADLTPTTGTVNIDFAAQPLRNHALSGDVTYTASNVAAGKSVTVRVTAGAESREVSFPADWKFVSSRPTSLAAGKTAVLAVTSFGASEAFCVAAWANEL